MCGIIGGISKNTTFVSDYIDKSQETQLHRGPNSQGLYIANISSWAVALSHQRLSILDLSDAGSQPMSSLTSNSIISYNGEVYNFEELGARYLDIELKSNTDTEVVINLLEKLGVKQALNAFNGMWAFAWLDLESKKIYLARDRVGVKPLYYYCDGEQLVFASEIKTILTGLDKKFCLNNQVVGEYLIQSLQDSSEATFFEGIHSLPAGCYAEINLNSDLLTMEIVNYWDPCTDSTTVSFQDALKATNTLFTDSVRLRMRSDVPVGVTLSGGVDSSAIAVVMKKFLSKDQKLKILSAVSPDSAKDESKFIDIMSEYLESPVEKIHMGWKPEEAMSLMRRVSWINDSPLGSFSNIAHYLLMEKAKDLGVTVILSGQGADELLCGYKKYLGFYLQSLLRNYKFIDAIRVFFLFIKNGSIIKQFNFQEAKRYLNFGFRSTNDISGPALKNFKPAEIGLIYNQSISDRQKSDLKRFSVPYLTHYEDRNSMAWSCEIRLPFLDYRLVEFFLSLPVNYKIFSGWTKYIFRKAFENSLPSSIIWRKDKQGFLSPQDEWIRYELKNEVIHTFNEDAMIFKLGFVSRENLLKNYEIFCSQKSGVGSIWYREIFNPFALEVWLQQYIKFIRFDGE